MILSDITETNVYIINLIILLGKRFIFKAAKIISEYLLNVLKDTQQKQVMMVKVVQKDGKGLLKREAGKRSLYCMEYLSLFIDVFI